MKKRALILTLIFIPLLSLAQLKGEYCISYGFGGECIKFYKNNNFKYQSSSCTQQATGQGTYELTENKLILYFESDGALGDDEQVKIESSDALSDTVWIEITTRESAAGQPLPFNASCFKDSLESTIACSVANFEGRTYYLLPKSNDALTLFVSSVGYKTFTYPLVPDKNYKLQIDMSNSGFYRKYRSGEIMSFDVREVNNKSIELTSDFWSVEFTRYVRNDRISQRIRRIPRPIRSLIWRIKDRQFADDC
ncbi:MAG: hypothetical protein IIA45_11300 [Bacteroidetes bacterium]|nr:hypothetical protein [Bacteroidota bacterium]